MSFLLLAALASAPGSWQWLMDLAAPVLVTQAVAGIIALVGLIFVLRRFLNVDFPAAMKEVNGRLETLHSDLSKLRDDFQQSKMELARLAERHDSLRGRVDRMEGREERLDDTGAGRRPPRGRT